MSRSMVLRLTWPGLEAAIDVIAAQCPRDMATVCGMDRGGQLLAWALADRLGLEVTDRPRAGGLLVYGVLDGAPRYLRVEIGMLWSWVSMTSCGWSVVKAAPGTVVLMPWQDAVPSRRPFVPGFDD